MGGAAHQQPACLEAVRAVQKAQLTCMSAMEFIDGQTLTQWMIDNPKPDLETVRGIVEQIAKGLGAFHRMEMLHQDVRPENIMIDKTGTVKIIDFGSTRVTGVVEAAPPTDHNDILGTVQYTAPEYFLGESGSPRSDLFSLGVITYQMLTGKLPYGSQAAKARTKSQFRKLRYNSALDDNREIPAWIDGALQKAVHPDPAQALRGAVGIRLRSSPTQYELPQFFSHPSHTTQSIAVLERPLFYPGMRRFIFDREAIWRSLSTDLAYGFAAVKGNKRAAQSASLLVSPVRMRIARSMSWTKIFPSPTRSVLAARRIAAMTCS